MRGASLMEWREKISYGGAVLLLGAIYFAAGKWGLTLAYVHASATPVWPPTGIAFAALLLFGERLWPGVFLGAFLTNVTTAGSFATSVGIAAGNTLEGLIGVALVNKFANGRRLFDQPQDVFKFVLFAGAVSTTISPIFGVTSLSLGGYASWSHYGTIWVTWWLGDAAGLLIVAPVLILWFVHPRLHWNLGDVFELVFLLLSIAVASQFAFGVWNDFFARSYSLSFLCIPPLVWTAFRFGPRETATANAILSGIAIRGTLLGFGPFVSHSPNESLLLLEAFTGVNAVMALALASVVSQVRRTGEALREARDELEIRVQQRTVELLESNEALKSEIDVRRLAEEGSRRAEENLRSLLESAPDALVITSEEGIIRLVNSQTERMFGYKREELLGQSIEILLPQRFRNVHRSHRSSYVVGPKPRPMGAGLELFAMRRDGSDFPVEISLSPSRTEDGMFITAAVRDITERKKAEERIQMLAQTLTSMNECVCITDLNKCIISVNPAFLKTYGYEESEILRQDVSILESQQTSHSSESSGTRAWKGDWTGDLSNRKKNGEEFPVLLSIASVHNKTGAPVAYVFISRDVSEQKALQRQVYQIEQQRTQDLQRFAASIQQAQEEERRRISRELHDDLSQRLSGMALGIQVLEDRVPVRSAGIQAKLKVLKAQIDAMITEVRRISSNLRPTSLDDFGLLTALQLLCKERETTSGFKIAFQADAVVAERHDVHLEIAVYRIVQEALTNAAKHANAKNVRVQLKQEDRAFVLAVEDDGRGFDESAMQARKRTERGLGLVSMKERSEHFGGTFRIQSMPGKGTRVEVEIPLTR